MLIQDPGDFFESNQNSSLFFSWILLQMAVKRTNVLSMSLIASCINMPWILVKGTWGSKTED